MYLKINLLATYRAYKLVLVLLYSIIKSGTQEFCPNQTDGFGSINNATNDDDDNDVKKFTDITKYIYQILFSLL